MFDNFYFREKRWEQYSEFLEAQIKRYDEEELAVVDSLHRSFNMSNLVKGVDAVIKRKSYEARKRVHEFHIDCYADGSSFEKID